MVKFLGGSQNNDNTNSRDYGILQSLWAGRVVIGIALLAVVLRACYSDWGQPDVPPGLVSTTEVVNNTEELINRSVTIRGRPQEIVGSSSFMVSDRRFFGGEPIMVVNATGQPVDLPTNNNIPVLVTGEVRNFVIPEIEREFNLSLQNGYSRDYINKPAIIARSITLAPKPGQITANPARYYGKRLVVTGEVENIQSPVLFSLDEDRWFFGEDLLVLLKNPPAVAINEDQPVTVIGVVRSFVVADIERDYDITWDLEVKKQLETEYENRPVLIAETIYPSDE